MRSRKRGARKPPRNCARNSGARRKNHSIGHWKTASRPPTRRAYPSRLRACTIRGPKDKLFLLSGESGEAFAAAPRVRRSGWLCYYYFEIRSHLPAHPLELVFLFMEKSDVPGMSQAGFVNISAPMAFAAAQTA